MIKFSRIPIRKLFILSIFLSGLLTACNDLQDFAVIVQPDSEINAMGSSMIEPSLSTGLVDIAIQSVSDEKRGEARATATRKAVDNAAEIITQERSTREASRPSVMTTPQPEAIAEEERQLEKRLNDLRDLEDRLREKELLPEGLSFFDPKTGFPADYAAQLELNRFGNPVRRPTTVDLDGDSTIVQAIMINVSPVGDTESALRRIEEIDQRKVQSQVALGAVIVNQTQQDQIPAGLYAIIGDLSLNQVFLLDQDLNKFPMKAIPLTRIERSSLRNFSDGMEGSDMPAYSDVQWLNGCWCFGIFNWQYYIINPLIWLYCNP